MIINDHIFVYLIVPSFSVTFIITLKTVCSLSSNTTQTLLLGHVHEA